MTREERKIVALAGCSHALSHAYLLVFPAVLLLLKEEFSIGYFGLGVIGNIMTFTYGLGSLPGGMIYNRFGPKRLYLFCFLGSAAASLLVALSPNLLLFTVGLAVLGALGSVYHPLVNVLITSKVKQYGVALGIHGGAGNIGVASAPVIAGFIASQWGWRWAYVFFSIPGILLSLWALTVDMSGPKKQEETATPPEVSPRSFAGMGKGFWLYFTLPLSLLYLMNCLQSFGFNGSVTFLPSFMAQFSSFHLFSWDSVAMGGMLSGLALLTGVFGQYIGGVLAQKPNPERNLVILTAAGLPFIALMSFVQDLPLLIMALVFFFFNFSLQPMMNVMLAHNTSPRMRGTAFGIYFFAAFGLGSLAASFSGYIAETFGLRWVFLGLSGGVLLAIFSSAIYWCVVKRRNVGAAGMKE
jgi:MFS family permease